MAKLAHPPVTPCEKLTCAADGRAVSSASRNGNHTVLGQTLDESRRTANAEVSRPEFAVLAAAP